MALQIKVTGPIITSAGEQYRNKLVNAEFILECWLDGVDIETTEPVISIKLSYRQKTQVESTTIDDLATRVEINVVKDMQKIINNYNYCRNIEAIERVTQMASNIQGALNG